MAKRDSTGLREEILTAVAPFLKEHGTAGTTVDRIMKAADLTSGALYSQFKNKDDLCTEAICSALDATLEDYRKVVRERGKEGLKFLTFARAMSDARAANQLLSQVKARVLHELDEEEGQ